LGGRLDRGDVSSANPEPNRGITKVGNIDQFLKGVKRWRVKHIQKKNKIQTYLNITYHLV
jgi:hypothetical protein